MTDRIEDAVDATISRLKTDGMLGGLREDEFGRYADEVVCDPDRDLTDEEADEVREVAWDRAKTTIPNLIGTTNASKTIVAQRPVSDRRGDKHLAYVLGFDETGEYVTWLYNAYSGGYGHGHYFRSFEDAVEDYKTR